VHAFWMYRNSRVLEAALVLRGAIGRSSCVGATSVSGELSFAAAVGILVASEKSAIDDRTGDGASVGEGRDVRVAVCLWVSSDEDIRNAVR
jgi:hypothetical protein